METNNIKDSKMSANDIIFQFYNELKKGREEYNFIISSSIYNRYDERENKTYSVTINHTRAIMVGDFLVTVGECSDFGLGEIGNCLEIIPLIKFETIESCISKLENFKAMDYIILFGDKDRLYIPKPGHSAMEFVVRPSDKATTHRDSYNQITLYASTVDLYDKPFLASLLSAFEIITEVNSKRANELKNKMLANEKCNYSNILRKLNDARGLLNVRVEMFYEPEYKKLLDTLDATIEQFNEVPF